jgi:hypothetical protein
MPSATTEIVGVKIINVIKGHYNLMAFYNYTCDGKKRFEKHTAWRDKKD